MLDKIIKISLVFAIIAFYLGGFAASQEISKVLTRRDTGRHSVPHPPPLPKLDNAVKKRADKPSDSNNRCFLGLRKCVMNLVESKLEISAKDLSSCCYEDFFGRMKVCRDEFFDGTDEEDNSEEEATCPPCPTCPPATSRPKTTTKKPKPKTTRKSPTTTTKKPKPKTTKTPKQPTTSTTTTTTTTTTTQQPEATTPEPNEGGQEETETPDEALSPKTNNESEFEE